MQPGPVVPGDVVDDGVVGGGAGRPGLPVQACVFQRGEERFGERVVPALTGAPDGEGDREFGGQGRVVAAGVLPWQPRSEWKITPVVGLRAATALASALETSSVRRWPAIANPTARRDAMSMTVAR